MLKLRWLGHAAFVVEVNGKVVLIDPWITNPLSPYRSIDSFTKDYHHVDLIIVTHDHGDHVGDSVELLRTYNKSRIVALYELAEEIARKANALDRSIGANIGGPVTIDNELTLVFTEAVHSSTIAHPSGVMIIGKNVSIYHAGDTGVFMDMKLIGELYNPTVALLPIGGWFTMGIKEAVKAVELIKPKYVIPIHYNTFNLIKADPKEFAKIVQEKVPGVTPIVLKPGEEIRIE
jgi:L-ascorbate metabolism protein UlaG (beta-lactamase superfamily)